MKVLIIPSATLVSKEIQKSVGKIPTVLCPLDNKSMLDMLYSQYKGKVDKIIIVGYERVDLIKEYIELKRMEVDLICLDMLLDVGYTVEVGIKKAFELYGNLSEVYVNFADTFILDLFDNYIEERVIYSDGYDGEEWTYFSYKDNEIERLWDKGENTNYDIGCKNLFVGALNISNPKAFLTFFENNKSNNSNIHDSLFEALLLYSKMFKIHFVRTEKWLDVGHNNKYFEAKTGVKARAFNTIEMDTKRGILKKTSKNKEKLINEIKWYLRLPDNLQYLIPRIYRYSLSLEHPYVEMEYYGYSTLHELLVWGNLPGQQWEKYFLSLKFIIQDMECYKYVTDEENKKKALRSIYIDKTMNRMAELKKNSNFQPFMNKPIIINNKQFLTLNEYIEALPQVIEDILIRNWNEEFNIIHGDLCFSNILIENTYGFMRVIDPRGKFGDFDIYGDSRYELAKLLHSIEGKYDFIIEDMFTLEIEDNNILFSIQEKEINVLQIFKEVFKEKLMDSNALQLIEATLFLSMIPLHSDNLMRQIAMLATGIQLLDKVIERREN